MTPVDRIALIALAGLVCHMHTAHAQNAGAEALFREGRRLIKQGKLQAGCEKMEESEKLESSVGTLLNLGDCREKLGKPASAWAAFRKAESLAKLNGNDKKRQREAKRRADKLEADLANLTVQVGPSSKNEGLVIKRDGEQLDPELWGTAIVVDPGSHVVTAEAPGRRPWRTEVSVGKGGKRWVVVPTLERVPEPPAPPPPVATTPEEPPPAQPAVVTEPPATRTVIVHPTWNATRGIAVALGIAGVAAIGTGAYFGNHANDLQSQSDAICPTTTCDDPEGLRLNDRAQDEALRANVLFAAGGVAVATATVMWFIGRPGETTMVTPVIGEDRVGATLGGRF